MVNRVVSVGNLTRDAEGIPTQGMRFDRHLLAQARRTLDVIDLVRRLDEQQRTPRAEETALLASWRGWGTVAAAFTGSGAGDPRWAAVRAAIEQRVSSGELAAVIAAGVSTSYFTDPRLVRAVWRLATELGFAGGWVLETGCGTGAFMAAAPPGRVARWTGVEPDPIAARIAALRFPGAEIVAKELQDVPLPDGSYDLAIGNVPFSNPDTHDLARSHGLSLHNYCLWRALQALRPGGLVVAITSRYTLDASSPHQRDRLAELGDLVGAIRLPSGAFRASGTAVVADIVALRRRAPGAAVTGGAWRAVTTAMLRAVPVNEYFARHPELVLGHPTVRPGRHRLELAVEPTGNTAAALDRATRHLVASAGGAGDRGARRAETSGGGWLSVPVTGSRPGPLTGYKATASRLRRAFPPRTWPAPPGAFDPPPPEVLTMPRTSTTQQAGEARQSNQRRSHGPSVNRVTAVGRITGEVVLRFTAKGVPYARFGLATNDRPEPEFHDICCWNAVARFAAEYLAKGRLVYCEGWLHGRTWQTEDGTTRRSVEIVAETVQALTPRPQEPQESDVQQ